MMMYAPTPSRGDYVDVGAAAACDSDGLDIIPAPRSLARRRVFAAGTVLGVAAGACLLGLVVFGAAAGRAARGPAFGPAFGRKAIVQLDSAEPAADRAKSWFLQPEKPRGLEQPLKKAAKAVQKQEPSKAPKAAPTQEPSAAPMASTRTPVQEVIKKANMLKPIEDLHDGNVCDLNEELFEGICYKKCALLTLGQEPIRTSPWTCCKEQPCAAPMNEDANFGKNLVCTGYDVSATGGCPHKPGACLTDEEMHLGVCYKKCSLLTNNAFPNRVAAATCCKTKGLGCLDVFNDKTSSKFDVGGGSGDHDASTPSSAHLPEQRLTEAKTPGKSAAPTPANASAVAALPKPDPMQHEFSSGGCKPDEELYGGLCYKKCGALTAGVAPIRTSSWTCCESHPCTLTNQKGSVGHTLLCNGYDVGSDGNCPKAPGTCPADEEEHLGQCYKKCSDLTNGKYPNRVAAATCCQGVGAQCWDLFNDKTSSAFAVGSGAGKDHKKPEYVQGQDQPFHLQK